MSEPLLAVRALAKHFHRPNGAVLRAVAGVSFEQAAGSSLGIVGESGCGKSTLARTLLRLIEPSAGSIRFNGVELTGLRGRALRAVRRDLQLVFQDPFASLDPRMRIGASLEEPLIVHRLGERAARRARVAELLALVGLEPGAALRYPHEFSGGQRQRIGIARALAAAPKLVVADEPVSALDVSIQAQILNLLADLRAGLGLSYLIISHDLTVIRQICDQVAVMYLGQFVEQGPAERIYAAPGHPYTQALLSAVPQPDPERQRTRIVLSGDVPNPEQPPAGCPFHPRCPRVMARCRSEPPAVRNLGSAAAPQLVRCHLY